MPDFILLLNRPACAAPALSPEQVSAVTKEYMGWSDRMRAQGHLRAAKS